MMDVAKQALDRKEVDVPRRAVEIALGFSGDDPTLLGEAARILQKTGAAPAQVDGLHGRALDLDPANAAGWIEWARYKIETHAPAGQVMGCFERALEADPDSITALLGFADSVLEVVAVERKLGVGAARENDKRLPKTLLGKARLVLEARAARRGLDPTTRERLLVAKGRVVLQQEGASQTVEVILNEIQKGGGKSAEARAPGEAVRSARAAAGDGTGEA